MHGILYKNFEINKIKHISIRIMAKEIEIKDKTINYKIS